MNPENPSKKPYRYPVWLLLAALYGLVTSASSLTIGAINFIQNLIFGTLLVASVSVLVIITVRHFKLRDPKSKVGSKERLRRLIGLTPSHCRNCGAKTIEERTILRRLRVSTISEQFTSGNRKSNSSVCAEFYFCLLQLWRLLSSL